MSLRIEAIRLRRFDGDDQQNVLLAGEARVFYTTRQDS
jgi:hypothetical protein